MAGLYHRTTLDLARVRDALCYDPISGSFTWRNPPNRSHAVGAKAGTVNDGYLKIGIFDTVVSAHMIAWWLSHGVWPIGQIDHINGNRLDNRLVNLRCVTKDQNSRNRKRHITNKSGFKGVWPQNGGWCAKIAFEKRKYYLGTFPTPEAAAAAYDDASERLHREYGRPNREMVA